MLRTCNAIAKSTGSTCQKMALPGSRYCLFHVDRGALLLAGIIGAVLSLMVSEGYRALVRSFESPQLAGAQRETSELKNAVTGLESQAANLRQEVTRYQNRLEEEREVSSEREQRHLAQVAELNAKLGPFIKTALARYPGLGMNEALDRLREEIKEVRALASPPLLPYATHRIQQSREGLIIQVRFSRSRDAALGRLVFRVTVPPTSSGRIRAVMPSGIATSVNQLVSGDGSSANLEYSAQVGDDPGINVALSGPARVRIEGNNGLPPTVLDVK
jgi:hypothetical protein